MTTTGNKFNFIGELGVLAALIMTILRKLDEGLTSNRPLVQPNKILLFKNISDIGPVSIFSFST